EHLVPVVRPEPAEVCRQHFSGARGGLSEGRAARVPVAPASVACCAAGGAVDRGPVSMPGIPGRPQKALTTRSPVESLIRVIRGQKVMLDRDLAELYGVRPIALRQQVKRNAARF